MSKVQVDFDKVQSEQRTVGIAGTGHWCLGFIIPSYPVPIGFSFLRLVVLVRDQATVEVPGVNLILYK